MKKVLLFVLFLGFAGVKAHAKCMSGSAAEVLRESVGLGSNFTISSQDGSTSVSVSGSAARAVISTAAGTFTGSICASKGRASGSFHQGDEIAHVTLSGFKGKVRAKGSVAGVDLQGTAI